MELLHPLRARQERKAEERINDVASLVSTSMITHLAGQAIGDLPIRVGRAPRHMSEEEFVERVSAKTYEAIEARAPHFIGKLAIDLERSRLASTENVPVGDYDWRNEIKADGITIVVVPVDLPYYDMPPIIST